MSQLTEKSVLNYFGSDESHVLSFGAMFWMYGFEKNQPYPLKGYFDYMDVDLYRSVVRGLRVAENIYQIVAIAKAYIQGVLETPVFVTGTGQTSTREMISALVSSIKESQGDSREFIAIHVRRGDYWNKCKHINDEKLRAHCYPTIERIEQVLEDYIESRKELDLMERGNTQKKKKKTMADKGFTVYIATNIEGSHAEFDRLVKKYKVVFFQDVFLASEADSGLDPSQMALIDVELCAHATMFFGNFFSSLSRSIYEQRELKSLPYSSF
jgi:hypothetical protein